MFRWYKNAKRCYVYLSDVSSRPSREGSDAPSRRKAGIRESSLPIAIGASFNSHNEEHNARCLPNTRTELLDEITTWADDKDGKAIFWLSGMAGTGKSTIARTIAQLFASRGQLGASFFFKKGEGERGNASRFFTTIALDLAAHKPGMLADQFEKLILQPLLGVHQARQQGSARVVVIDALDECEREEDIRAILQLLARTKDIGPIPLRIVVTSRPELHIRLSFKEMPNSTYQDLVLHKVPRSTIKHDICLFLEYKLALVKLAVPLFIYAATVCRYVGTKGGNPKAYLEKVLQYRKANFSQLDRTYLPILDQLLVEQEEDEKEVIVVLESPLSIASLACLLHILQEEVKCQLNSLHSVLSVPNSEDVPIRLLHLSFREFLVEPRKQGKSPFWVDEKSAHNRLASRCLELMSRQSGLRQDMCSLVGPGVLRSEIDDRTVASSLPPELQESSRCFYLLDSLYALAGPSASSISAFLHDAKRFVLRFQSVLADAPLQIYCSALVFAPEKSLTRQAFIGQVLQRVNMLSTREADWDACRSTLEGHSRYVTALVASASDDKTVRLWEAATGTCRSTLKGHFSYVSAVAFSPDGQLVASASYDKSVRLWEAATGTCRSTLEGYSKHISHITFSSDGQVLHTNAGDISLSPLLIVQSPSWQQEQSSNVLVQDQWILRNQQRFLWLPSEYRTIRTSVRNNVVCLGLLSGRVVLLKIA
ncbi:hypothetical protein CC86DRAFT_433807 [Ophiobolus disseminans]|uniref:Mitochondrial division protein 1 n=1 Tax=Ophiobolus disseminans TaxID=1469910 RepID=A0A6A6ZBC3_9PLEO|nr:hypothetical protein CC86DRAFT_433807 [Ophiobolus disseminans]